MKEIRKCLQELRDCQYYLGKKDKVRTEKAEDKVEKIFLDMINKEFDNIPSNKVIKDTILKNCDKDYAKHYYQVKFDVLMNLMAKIKNLIK